jgi:WD40 repeat protein
MRVVAARRQRFLLGGVSLALAVSIALGVVAVLQRNTANERARVARSQALAAQATQALSSAPVTALADAVKAAETKATPEAEVALRRAILANPVDYVIPGAVRSMRSGVPRPPQEQPNEGLTFSRDGKLLLGLPSGSKLAVWRSSDGRRVATIAKADHALFGRGDHILSTDGKTIRFGRIGRPPAVTRAVRSGSHAVALGFAENAPLALLAGHRAAQVVQVASGSVVALRAPTVAVADAAFSGDGRRVLTENPAFSQVRVWNAVTGRLITTLPDGCLAVGCAVHAVLSADGRFAATSVGLWSVDLRRRLAVFDASKVVFSPDGRLLVAVRGDGEATVYRSGDGTVSAEFPGFGSLFHPGVNVFTPFNPAAAFSADDEHLAIADSDGSVRIWELASTEQVAAVHAGWVNELVFAPFGNRLAAMTWNGDVVVAAAPASSALRTHQGPASPEHWNVTPAVSADGLQVMAPVNWAAGAGEVGVWSVDGRLARVLRPPAQGLPGVVTAEAFSGDGSVVAAETSGPGGIASTNERFGTIVAHLRGRAAPLRLWATGSRSSSTVVDRSF